MKFWFLVAASVCWSANFASSTAAPPLDAIDGSTRWTIEMLPAASVTKPVVYLSDVARLIGTHAAWDRIGQTPIAMIPSGSMQVQIDRQRLADWVASLPATPTHIDWVGAAQSVVRRDTSPTTPAPVASTIGGAINHGSIETVSYESQSQTEIVSAAERQRFEKLFQYAMQRFAPEILQQHTIAIDSGVTAAIIDGNIVSIVPGSMIPSKSLDDRSELQTMMVSTRSRGLTYDGEVVICLTPHPEPLVASVSIQRGDIAAPRLFTSRSTPDEDIPDDAVFDAADLAGLEATQSLRAGGVVRRSMFRQPLVIKRGEVIEVRVVGGGVSVTTNAKSLSDGEMDELIEVETIPARRRVIARVAGRSLAEIATRAPVVR